jgi:hypothetical protein
MRATCRVEVTVDLIDGMQQIDRLVDQARAHGFHVSISGPDGDGHFEMTLRADGWAESRLPAALSMAMGAYGKTAHDALEAFDLRAGAGADK